MEWKHEMGNICVVKLLPDLLKVTPTEAYTTLLWNHYNSL